MYKQRFSEDQCKYEGIKDENRIFKCLNFKGMFRKEDVDKVNSNMPYNLELTADESMKNDVHRNENVSDIEFGP